MVKKNWLMPRGGRPGVGQFPPRRDTFPKVKVDQRLVTNAGYLCQTFEVAHRLVVKPNGHLLLQMPGIRIALGFRKVVMLSHGIPQCTYNVMGRQRPIATSGVRGGLAKECGPSVCLRFSKTKNETDDRPKQSRLQTGCQN